MERIIQVPKPVVLYKDYEKIVEYVTEVPTVEEYEVQKVVEEIEYQDVEKIIEVPVVTIKYIELERPVIKETIKEEI